MKLDDIRGRLDALSWQMLLILKERLLLVEEVARQKMAKGDGVIHAPGREAAIFDRTVDHCGVLGLDPDYVLEIVSLTIAHAKDAECDVLGVDTFLDTRPKDRDELTQNLLSFLRAFAEDGTSDYCNGKGTDAIQLHLQRERNLLQPIIQALSHQGVALDLGRATGEIPKILEPHFSEVICFDASPELIAKTAASHTWQPHVSFVAADLNARIPVSDNAVSFAVANFGAASEISTVLFPELSRVLKPGGKAFLSFYNRDAISNLWYYPWPSTLRAHLNTYNNTLEVWYAGQVYVIHAASMTREALSEAAQRERLHVTWMESHPTILSILPRFFFGSDRFRPIVEAVTDLDQFLVGQDRGTYLTALVEK